MDPDWGDEAEAVVKQEAEDQEQEAAVKQEAEDEEQEGLRGPPPDWPAARALSH